MKEHEGEEEEGELNCFSSFSSPFASFVFENLWFFEVVFLQNVPV
jgi:hypothetical protein